MTSGRVAALTALAALAAACGGSSHPAAFHVAPGDNVLAVSVNGIHCGGGSSYVNEPCVSVTICAPGTATCQTIDDVLLDTGSIGLRIFKQALTTVSLPSAPAPGGGNLAECIQYADGTADWGPVEVAEVTLANEPPVQVPIQVIDATFGAVPSTCPSPETAPTSFSGILGLGVFVEDCGAPCPADANVYFAWDGTSLTSQTLDASLQVQNPAALLPVDNNGFIVQLPAVSGGAPAVEGAVVLGIGTRPNNHPVSASALALDGFGEFSTTLAGGSTIAGSFVDTGSNGLFFAPPAAVAACSDNPDWFCPPATLAYSATNVPSPGFPGNHLGASFQIGNFDALVAQPSNAVFPQIGGGALPSAGFDWGVPFFLGRTVYLGIDGRPSIFGNGPLLAY